MEHGDKQGALGRGGVRGYHDAEAAPQTDHYVRLVAEDRGMADPPRYWPCRASSGPGCLSSR